MGLFTKIKEAITPKSQYGDLTSSNLSVAELRDYVSSTGDVGRLNLYGVGGYGGVRNQALTFAAYFRVVTLLSSLMAQLITSGSLRVHNTQGKIDNGIRSRRLLDLLQHSPDGVTPSFQFIEDLAIDYLMEGNALLSVERAMGRVSALHRLQSHSALLEYDSDGMAVYQAHRAYDYRGGTWKMYADADILHARWPLLFRQTSSSGNRARFAREPVLLMRPAIQIGLESDRFIQDWYKLDSPKSNVGISFKHKLKPEQLEQIRTQIERASTGRAPLIMADGATFTPLNNSSVGTGSQAAQRDFQVNEICRIYGVPGSLVNQNITSWGSGIEQLIKGAYKFSLRQHVQRLLDPMEMKLLPMGFKFRFDETDLLRGDAQGIATLLNSLRGDAQRREVATIEEQRRIAGLPIEPEYGELQDLPEQGGGGMPMNNDDGAM